MNYALIGIHKHAHEISSSMRFAVNKATQNLSTLTKYARTDSNELHFSDILQIQPKSEVLLDFGQFYTLARFWPELGTTLISMHYFSDS